MNDAQGEARHRAAGADADHEGASREADAASPRSTSAATGSTSARKSKPGVPAAFHPLAKDAPAESLGLAKWLVSPENPLTARVAVNRFWEQIFGVGLVETPEDFGIRSKPPTASRTARLARRRVLRADCKWDVKKLLKLIVTSATYRQSSKVTPEMVERDPDNRYFARGPRFRSSAEVDPRSGAGRQRAC